MTRAAVIEPSRNSIDLAVITFDAGGNGRVMSELDDLVGRGVIRIIELAMVEMTEDGSVRRLTEIESFDHSGVPAAPLLAGATPMVAERLSPGTTAMVVVWENLWAARLTTALRDAGGTLVETTSSVFEVCAQL